MGIVDSAVGKGLQALGLGNIGASAALREDFEEGLLIAEVKNGIVDTLNGIQLAGVFKPFIPFSYGGAQNLKKDYYPGNKEPVMQIFGPQEHDVTIKGRLKTKRFKNPLAVKAAELFSEEINAMRERGNVVRVTLGEWQRYAVIEEATFDLKRLTDIDYSIKFSIIGKDLPKNCKIINPKFDTDIDFANALLRSAITEELLNMRNYPDSMPISIVDLLNKAIDSVASVLNAVTNFVDDALKQVEGLENSATRALGLIKNARATISKTSRRIGAIQLGIPSLSVGAAKSSLKAAYWVKHTQHILSLQTSLSRYQNLLASLAAKYKNLSQSNPLKRHLVKRGQTLQKISVIYYNTPDNWKLIYDHNRLTSTDLTIGAILEIPEA